MRLLPILLLCSYCLLGSATLIDVECNDQNVFRAVDEALRSFNNEKEDGNQFILYRITDAKIKNEEGGQINHFVQYETYEGSCKVKNGKSWQECSSTYKNPAKCSAHVLFNKDQSFNSVEYQQCTNSNDIELNPVTAVHQPCLGCPQPIDKENKELLCFVHSAIEQVNADANHSLYFDLESIVNATRQVTNGWQYHIQFLIRQTNCSKSSFTSKHSMECILDQGGESIVCNARVHVTSKGEVGEPFVECKSGTGVCINCPIVLSFEDPELQTLLVQVMDEYNFNSNHTQLYNVAFIERAEKKGFQRELYDVSFSIYPTNCSKSDYSILGSECDFNYSSPHLSCRTKINVTDKTINVHSAPHCTIGKKLSLRYGGLSPLRISRNSNRYKTDINSMSKSGESVKRPGRTRQRRHGHENNRRHKNGKKEKKHKEKGNKHNNHENSSDEDTSNEVTQATPLQPTNLAIQEPGTIPTVQQAHEVSDNQEISPNKNETSLLEFTNDIGSRCPGRVWQPISLTHTNPTVRTFSDHDLEMAIDNSTSQ